MASLALLVLCFAAGMLLRRSGRLPDTAPAALNGVILHVSLPALVLLHVQNLVWSPELLLPALMPWALFAFGLLFFLTVSRLCGWSRETTGGLILTGSLANTSFVGIPMIEAFYGAGMIAVGILADQLGTYMVLSTVGILVAALFAGSGQSAGAVARRILSFPPFLALLAALAMTPLTYPDVVREVLARLADTLVPLALVSVGLQLRLADLKGRLGQLSAGLGFKLVIGPALVASLFLLGFGLRGEVVQVTVFEASMGPQIGASIVAIQHKLDAPLVTLLVGIGIPLSILTATVWWWLLQGFG